MRSGQPTGQECRCRSEGLKVLAESLLIQHNSYPPLRRRWTLKYEIATGFKAGTGKIELRMQALSYESVENRSRRRDGIRVRVWQMERREREREREGFTRKKEEMGK